DPQEVRTAQIRSDVPLDSVVDVVPQEPSHVGAPESVARGVEVLLGVRSPVVMTVHRYPPEESPLSRETSQNRQHALEPGMRLVRSVGEVAMVSCPDPELQDKPHQQGPEQVRFAHEPRCGEEQVGYEKGEF